ncbi:MAG: polyprenyl synthetase family protein [Desulfatirhabdiaceae bacterium]
MSMIDLAAYLSDKQQLIESALSNYLPDASAGRLTQAMAYSLMNGGKRLRPILCMAACESMGGTAAQVLPVACAIEMIHTYSLIHDDLPALDNDVLRRGRPTCHMAFDEATAILAGDGLLTLSFQLLSEFDDMPAYVSKDIQLTLISLISKAAGYQGMIEGQMRDLLSEGQSISLQALEGLHLLKTGSMIEASVVSGTLLGGGSPEAVTRMKQYARCIGLAFQIQDDILNVEGDPDIMGKSAGTDQLHKKGAYPALLGLEKAKVLAEELIDNALLHIDIFDSHSDPLRAIALYTIRRNK